MSAIALIGGIAAGALCVWLWARGEIRRRDDRLALAERSDAAWDEKLKALTADALSDSQTKLLELADAKLQPVKETLEKFEQHSRLLEEKRLREVGAIPQLVEGLRKETGNLVTALRTPHVRGRWGELQLRNVVEAAGMLDYCDFVEQSSVSTEDSRLRPDLLVRLPGGRQVVVDAKASIQALLDAEAADDPALRDGHLDSFVRHVRDHVAALSRKAYWEQFSPAPDFVIMFLPGEGFYRMALERDPSLIELAPGQRVHIASPSTLITMLRAIAVGWREAEVAENAREIEKLGRELYERLATMSGHFGDVGKHLDKAVQMYNQAIGSLERRVLPQARRFLDHGVDSDKQLPELTPIDRTAQPPQTIELPTRAA